MRRPECMEQKFGQTQNDSSMEGVYKDGKCREKEMGLQPVFCIFIADGHFIYGAGSAAGRIK